MINILKKLFIIYNFKLINEKKGSFFINHEDKTYVFFRNFMFLGSIDSLYFFHLYLSFLDKCYIINLLIFQFIYLINFYQDNFNSNNFFCIKKVVNYK